MATNAQVEKNEGETAINLIRRFSKRVQGAQIIQSVRAGRYYTRTKSAAVARKKALKVIRRRAEIHELIKLGKMIEAPIGKRRR